MVVVLVHYNNCSLQQKYICNQIPFYIKSINLNININLPLQLTKISWGTKSKELMTLKNIKNKYKKSILNMNKYTSSI